MKETQPLEKDEIRHEIPAQHQKKQQLLARKPLKRGQTLYEFNFKENTLKKAELKKQKDVTFQKASGIKKIAFDPLRNKFENLEIAPNNVEVNKDCVYIPALNFQNAIRHIHNKIAPNINPKIIE